MAAANTIDGGEIILKWMSDLLENRNVWKFEVQSSIELEVQHQKVWCWVASARMFANHYSPVFYDIQQEDAVEYVLGKTGNDAIYAEGDIEDTVNAISYFMSEGIYINDLKLQSYTDAQYSESTLKQFLNDGHVVWIGRAKHSNGTRYMGHAYVIVGYTSEFDHGVIQYEYILFDPYPADEPASWDDSSNLEGQIHNWTYLQICDGGEHNPPGDTVRGIWDWIIVAETPYSEDIIVLD